MHPLTPTAPHPTTAAVAEVKVGLRSLPYLADHGFQDMIVLPGSFYMELAWLLHGQPSGQNPCVLRNVRFEHPVILSEEDTVIRITARNEGDHTVEYRFHDATTARARDNGQGHCLASVKARHGQRSGSDHAKEAFSIRAFKEQAAESMTAEAFYGKLRENGNQYGPRFQNISGVWRSGDTVLCELRVPDRQAPSEAKGPNPALMDSFAQVLAAFILDRKKTFILRSIDQVSVLDNQLPATLWACATLRSGSGREDEGFIGDIRVFDGDGRTYLEFSGVAFAFLERVESGRDDTAVGIRVASNFTAEPLEESLRFWGDQFNVPLRIEFAPYNQVFQQLLDPASPFRANRDGINAILLRLEDWVTPAAPAFIPVDRDRLESAFNGHPRRVLPNGLDIVHLNPYETDHLYQEIFEDQTYLKHGIRLRDGDTVIDIGANIGLFSLFVLSRCRNPRIHAYEPSPVVYELLKANCEAHGSHVHALNLGVADRPGTAAFTFYEKSSVFSGFHSDEAGDREAIRSVVRNSLKEQAGLDEEALEQYVNELTEDRLRRRSFQCRLTSVSEIIRDQRIDRVDLLKIDAEKSELDILRGIGEGDWPKIGQIVIEVHDHTRAALDQVIEILEARGFSCAVEEEKRLEHSGLFNVYATRGTAAHTRPQPDGLRRNVREFQSALESFMSRSEAPMILCLCPPTPAAEADPALKQALDEAARMLVAAAGQLPGLRIIDPESLVRRYSVRDWHDPQARQLGHIPFTAEGYAAIGTSLFRTLFNLKSRPFKVIVLDCDNTLWKGVCGEAGPAGIDPAGPYRALQEFMVARMNEGMLLCLCSRNNEKDVWDVFEQRQDMVLKREHLVGWRINWQPKSGNLKSLADELNLGLDSFIFIDDNPVECAEVEAGCPGVLTLRVPANQDLIPSFLDHVWAFDPAAGTGEGRTRTLRYQQNVKREEFRRQSISLNDFIEGLQLRVEIEAPADDHLGRVAELTLRTNQFNFTTRRRTDVEIRNFLQRGNTHCLGVRVTDRFGDYGLVGVLMYETAGDRCRVDTLLLSCRVLGRGVEHRLLADLGRRALKEGIQWVDLGFRPTEKNLPALEFLRAIADQYRNARATSSPSHAPSPDPAPDVSPRPPDAETVWTFPAEFLGDLEYKPGEESRGNAEEDSGPHPDRSKASQASTFGNGHLSERMQRIGDEWREMDQLMRAMESDRRSRQPLPDAAELPPVDTLEGALSGIWSRVLDRPRIGVNENFFEAGGTSLKAVRVVATINRELGRNVSLVSLFESPTVRLLAARLSGAASDSQPGIAPAAAILRGRQRRIKKMRRNSPLGSVQK